MFYALWSTHGKDGSIGSAWMDGTHRKIIIDNNKLEIFWPNSLSIDFKQKKLYWCDPQKASIERCDFDGENRDVLFLAKSDTFYPYSMGLGTESLYISDKISEAILEIPLNNISKSLKM